MASALLGSARLREDFEDIVSRFGLMAIDCVLPARLGTMPIDTIIKLRQNYESEFFAFTRAVEDVTADLREKLTGVVDRQALDVHLEAAAREHFAVPLEDLRKAMKGVGLDTITTAFSTKFELPTSAALATALAATVVRGTQRQRKEVLENSPVSYLLRVERGLKPKTAVRRVIQNSRRGREGSA
ncbi:DUF6236 family protein [Streptomyces sp. NPDC050315]|uniref:DUF6236 family protein n=1 Tax=Streptomyces sp. NPDC050315 TaxID=3155039 RepID=UPI003413CC5D